MYGITERSGNDGMKVSRRAMLTGCVAFTAVGWAGLGTAKTETKRPTITVYKEPT
jgi:hypothetical protein